ncbi:DNA primase family protein [Paraburkholderia graminis]|uniref:DNA primase family protein n=1 Tax=Paraburkholderia graminis TaxID=60548 RepID=UPI000412EE52
MSVKRFAPHTYAAMLVGSGNFAQDGGVLYQWSGTHWSPIDDEDGERQAYHWLVKRGLELASPENARKAHKAAVLYCGNLPPTTRDVVIPCANGYVHAVDGRLSLQSADPALGLRHVLTCRYETEAPPPRRFAGFIETILPDAAVRRRVQEYIGYTLTADARYQRAQLWLGGGANGKGVLANIVQALHGKPESIQLDALEGFRLSVLVGASLIYCDEVPRGRINEQLLKSMIAGERIQVDRKYREPISIHVRGKWLVLGNHLPTITDHSAGFWRRWDIVPFSVTIPEAKQDPILAERIIAEELSGVLSWALEGLARLQARGAFDPTVPEAMGILLKEAKSETNSVQAWFDDCSIAIDVEHNTTKENVYDHYRDWCARNGLSAMASPRFWTRMRDIVPVEESRRRQGRTQVRVCNVLLPDRATAAALPTMKLVSGVA